MFNSKNSNSKKNNWIEKLRNNSLVNNSTPLSNDEKERRKKRIINYTILFVILAVIIIIICCVVLNPKTIDLVITGLSSSTSANNMIYLNTNHGLLVINLQNLTHAKSYAVDVTSNYTTYALWLSHSSLGQVQFQYNVYNSNSQRTNLILGSTVIPLNVATSALKTLHPNISSALLQNETNFLNYVYHNTNIVEYPSKGISWGLIIQIIFLVILVLFLLSLIFSVFKNGSGMMGGDLFSIGKSLSNVAKPNVKFDDVGGINEEKYELQEIVDFLKYPSKYVQMGARVPKGVILYGPPGTGKTLLAKAVAGEANVPFYETSGSTFEDMLVGVGAKRIRDLFNKAKKTAPAIIFIDEIDAVASSRNNNKIATNDLGSQTLNQLLAEMDGFNNKTGVIVIAATNRLDSLDEAILRPGRFDRQIQVNLPDVQERVQILKIHAKNKKLASDVSFEEVARKTPGFSGAQLENVLNEAALMAVRKKHQLIDYSDIDEGIDRVVGGPAKHTRKISFEEKKQVAFHEAGHALVGLYVAGSDIVEKITIVPRGLAGGYTVRTPATQEKFLQSKADLNGALAALLGGRGSEEVIYGLDGISTGAADDLQKATELARNMVMKLGMSDLGLTDYVAVSKEQPYNKPYSENINAQIDETVKKLLDERYVYAKGIIKAHERELELIVESLLILETINRKEINYIHQKQRLPHNVVQKIYYLLDSKQLDEKYLFSTEKVQFIDNINNPYSREEETEETTN